MGRPPEITGFRLWLFASLRGGGPPYNPRDPVKLLPGNEWTITETGEKRGNSESKHYAIFVVGEAREVLIREYLRQCDRFSGVAKDETQLVFRDGGCLGYWERGSVI